MNAILRLIFPATPSGAGTSWLLLAARIVFGTLMMTHGIAKWQHFATLSATFPDPLGLGSRTSLVLAIFAEVVCTLGFITGTLYRLALVPMIFTMCVAFFSVHGGDPFAAREPGHALPHGLRAALDRRSRTVCRRQPDRPGG